MLIEREHQRDERAGDRRRARAAVGLNDVAVDPHRALAELLEPHHGAHRSADQPLNLHRPAADLARRRLARGARGGGARQHAVFGGDPALAGAAQERRHAILDAGRADHAGVADLDEHRAFGVQQKVGRDDWSDAVRAARDRCMSHGQVDSRRSLILSQRTAQVHMSRERVDLVAVDEQLHLLHVRQVGGDGVDDGVDGEELVHASRPGCLARTVSSRSTNASLRSDTYTPRSLVPCRDRRHERRRRDGGQLRLDERARLRHGALRQRDLLLDGDQPDAVRGREEQRGLDARDGRPAPVRRRRLCRRIRGVPAGA